jgi:hypothetical protein
MTLTVLSGKLERLNAASRLLSLRIHRHTTVTGRSQAPASISLIGMTGDGRSTVHADPDRHRRGRACP